MKNTINVNGTDVPTQKVMLTFAKASLRILAAGMTIRNVNLKRIKMSLQEHGVTLVGRTVNDCLVEVDKMLVELNGNIRLL
jgi:hypothetical protein